MVENIFLRILTFSQKILTLIFTSKCYDNKFIVTILETDAYLLMKGKCKQISAYKRGLLYILFTKEGNK